MRYFILLLFGFCSCNFQQNRCCRLKVKNIDNGSYNGVIEIIYRDSLFNIGDTIWIIEGGISPRKGIITDKMCAQ